MLSLRLLNNIKLKNLKRRNRVNQLQRNQLQLRRVPNKLSLLSPSRPKLLPRKEIPKLLIRRLLKIPSMTKKKKRRMINRMM